MQGRSASASLHRLTLRHGLDLQQVYTQSEVTSIREILRFVTQNERFSSFIPPLDQLRKPEDRPERAECWRTHILRKGRTTK
jgi:hypothetical protein